MIKLLCIILLSASSFSFATKLPDLHQNVEIIKTSDIEQWGNHLLDFLELLDLESVFGVIMKYINDPEVQTFLGYVLSPRFTELIGEFETMKEFKEAVTYLESKGYDIKTAINFINSVLELPPFEKSSLREKTNGISGLFEELVEFIPFDKMKELFEEKLANDKEVAQLFNTLTSEEFVDIMKRMAKNPTFLKTKETLEGFGFDFKGLCLMAQNIFGDYYMGIFCDELL